jgi:hypothetical protein
MALTRVNTRSAIRTLLNEPVAKFFTDIEINGWIDEGCRDICIMTLCSTHIGSAITTTSGISTYAYPVTVNTTAVHTIAIKTLLDSSSRSLTYITPDLIGRTENESQLPNWTEWGNSFILSPAPQTATTITPLLWTEVGCTADETLQLPSAYHHLVVLYGSYKGFQKRRSYAEAAALFQQYTSQMDRVTTKLAQKFGIVDPKQTVKDHPPGD